MLPSGIGFTELLVVAIVAVLLFGSRLPEVAKNMGKTYQQFRKGLADLQSTIKIDDDHPGHSSSSTSNRVSYYKDALDEETNKSDAPRFTVPPSPPATETKSE
ncbi:MAG: twin-arginine translocase TatA/TatE family subunit [Pirellulaceae bacterium]